MLRHVFLFCRRSAPVALLLLPPMAAVSARRQECPLVLHVPPCFRSSTAELRRLTHPFLCRFSYQHAGQAIRMALQREGVLPPPFLWAPGDLSGVLRSLPYMAPGPSTARCGYHCSPSRAHARWRLLPLCSSSRTSAAVTSCRR